MSAVQQMIFETRIGPIEYGSAEYDATLDLRHEVLLNPLGISLDRSQIQAERADHHIACVRDARLVACLVLTPEATGVVRMRQVAVATDCQHQGIGKDLVQNAEQFAAAHGYSEITAHARETALRFYEKLGYVVAGDRFIEAGLPHFIIRKSLRPA